MTIPKGIIESYLNNVSNEYNILDIYGLRIEIIDKK